MNHNTIIAKEGWPFIFLTLLLVVPIYISQYSQLAILPAGLAIFFAWFFRNPERNITTDSNTVLSPADGKIMDVTVLKEEKFIDGEVIRVRIFMNVFNVHINRVPVSGTVEQIQQEGKFNLPAFLDRAADMNVRNYILLNTAFGKILVVQITGLIARRLVCWIKPKDQVASGERLGLIRFGSCTEIYLPLNTEILVKPGQKVKGGVTSVGKFMDKAVC